jgi:hypothetical protein
LTGFNKASKRAGLGHQSQCRDCSRAGFKRWWREDRSGLA